METSIWGGGVGQTRGGVGGKNRPRAQVQYRVFEGYDHACTEVLSADTRGYLTTNNEAPISIVMRTHRKSATNIQGENFNRGKRAVGRAKTLFGTA